MRTRSNTGLEQWYSFMAINELEVSSSSLSADKLFKLFHDFDTLAPKLEPQNYKAINLLKAVVVLEASRALHTVMVSILMNNRPFNLCKHKIDAIDRKHFNVNHTIIEGDALLGILDSATHHIKFVPSADGGAVFKDNVVLKCKGNAKPTEETLN
ncbi:root allergen protein-like protein [Tanacetum coccineum]